MARVNNSRPNSPPWARMTATRTLPVSESLAVHRRSSWRRSVRSSQPCQPAPSDNQDDSAGSRAARSELQKAPAAEAATNPALTTFATMDAVLVKSRSL